jgi:hypothetical protein
MTNHDEVEILLVEDNPHDAEMALRALKKTTSQRMCCMLLTAKKRLISYLCAEPTAGE